MTAQDGSTARGRAALGLLGPLLTAAAAGALGYLLGRDGAPPAGAERDLDTQQAARVAASPGVFDSHPDADVARVLQPGLVGREHVGVPVSTNAIGLREREFAMPKPPGVVRIVLLGDSFVYGWGVADDARLGAVLERRLGEHRGATHLSVEVLHVGIPGWNIVAECALLRRLLHRVEPDLVVHVSIPNDLDDVSGARGFGEMARHVPAAPQQGGAMVRQAFAAYALDADGLGYLAAGLDHESRHRFEQAARAATHLARLTTERGGRYLHLFHWGDLSHVAARHLASRLDAEQVAWLPASFFDDVSLQLAADDPHWNAAGHELVATVVEGLIVERGLLPQLALGGDAALAPGVRALLEEGAADAARPAEVPPIARYLDFRNLDPTAARQVHTGVRSGRGVMPYASMILARGDGTRLWVVGKCRAEPALTGGQIEIFVDETLVQRVDMAPEKLFDLTLPLPEPALQRDHVSIRFASNDYVLVDDGARTCASFFIQGIAILP